MASWAPEAVPELGWLGLRTTYEVPQSSVSRSKEHSSGSHHGSGVDSDSYPHPTSTKWTNGAMRDWSFPQLHLGGDPAVHSPWPTQPGKHSPPKMTPHLPDRPGHLHKPFYGPLPISCFRKVLQETRAMPHLWGTHWI